MQILGIILSLSAEPALRQQALQHLNERADLELGPEQAHGFPAVLEVASSADGRSVLEELTACPGVLMVSVAFANFSDSEEPES